MKKSRPTLRILFDELVSPKIARALAILDINASYIGSSVGSPVPPPKSSTDEEVLNFAAKTNQVVVSNNHDLIVMAAERQQPVIWVDPCGRQLHLEQWVALCFRDIRKWDHFYGKRDMDSICVRTMRSGMKKMSFEEAKSLAEKRMKIVETRKAKRDVRSS